MNKKGIFSMILGLLLMAAALYLGVQNVQDGLRAGEAAHEAVVSLQEELPQRELRPASKRKIYQPELFQYFNPEQIPKETTPEEPVIIPAMATTVEKGYEYIGVLTVPSLDLTLPIMAQWDYDRLQIAPCVYTGSYYTNDLVICGHNYATHFSPLRTIPLGAEIYLTAVDGYVYRYLVDNVETVAPTEIDRMITGTDWDLTLFTCHIGGQTRCAIRCVLAD